MIYQSIIRNIKIIKIKPIWATFIVIALMVSQRIIATTAISCGINKAKTNGFKIKLSSGMKLNIIHEIVLKEIHLAYY